MRPAELHSLSAEKSCMTENVSSLRSVKVATPHLRRLCGYPLWTCRPQTVLTNRSPPASLKIVNDNLTKERERMKKIMFGNSLMLLGIAIMILAGLKVIYVGTLWVSFLLIIVGFVMATIGFFGKDSK